MGIVEESKVEQQPAQMIVEETKQQQDHQCWSPLCQSVYTLVQGPVSHTSMQATGFATVFLPQTVSLQGVAGT